MHYLVIMLVTGENTKEALENAESDCEILLERGDCDWYTLDGRWGKSKAYGINSEKGEELLREGMEANRRDFELSLEAIRYMFNNYSDEQIYNEEFSQTDQHNSEYYLSRYQFSVASGRTNGVCVYALDNELWGSRIENDKDLATILKDNNKKLWVVPVDIHN